MSEHNNKLELLGSAPIPKALMSLGVPIMIGMLINALYNLVDAYFVSGLGKSQMGAFHRFPVRTSRSWIGTNVWQRVLHPTCQDFWDEAIRILPIRWQVPLCIAAF